MKVNSKSELVIVSSADVTRQQDEKPFVVKEDKSSLIEVTKVTFITCAQLKLTMFSFQTQSLNFYKEKCKTLECENAKQRRQLDVMNESYEYFQRTLRTLKESGVSHQLRIAELTRRNQELEQTAYEADKKVNERLSSRANNDNWRESYSPNKFEPFVYHRGRGSGQSNRGSTWKKNPLFDATMSD